MTSGEPDARAQLTQLLSGYQRSQITYVAAKLGLADLLAGGPMSSEELAAETGTHAPSLFRLLRTLAGYGLLRRCEDGRFETTELLQLLRKDAPGSLHAMALVQGDDIYSAWGELLHSVQTGRPGFEKVYGEPAWAYREHNPDANQRFNAYMSSGAQRRVQAFIDAYELPKTGVVVDAGGGDGTLLAAILRRYPGLHGVLFDLPHVVAQAASLAHDAAIKGRFEVQGGSFFDAVPPGGDVYILSQIVHDWLDPEGLAILKRCREAMSADARLVLLENVWPEQPGQAMADLLMMVTNGGRERTESEWRGLLADARLELTRIVPTGGISVLEAKATNAPSA